MKYDFEHYLQADHGRAYMIAKADPERYREKMINRGMLTDELKEELRWDANLDISKMVDDDREEE